MEHPQEDGEYPPAYAPQAITDILPIYHPPDADGRVSTYRLRQVSANTQTLLLRDDPASAPAYTIKTFQTGGFLNRKPHVVISHGDDGNQSWKSSGTTTPNGANTQNRRHSLFPSSTRPGNDASDGRSSLFLSTSQTRRFSVLPRSESPDNTKNPKTRVAEARYDIGGTGTTIDYTTPPSTQTLDLESSQTQCLFVRIAGLDHWWKPHPGNRSVLELTNEAEDVVARFIYAEPVALMTGPGTGRKKSVSAQEDVGEMEIVEALVGEGREEILCSGVVVIERAKRRAANIGRQGVGYKQGAACGPTTNCYGGGVQMTLGP